MAIAWIFVEYQMEFSTRLSDALGRNIVVSSDILDVNTKH
jgi:hypothetical protein